MISTLITLASATGGRTSTLNTTLEYILVGIVALAVLIYLLIALLAPEKF